MLDEYSWNWVISQKEEIRLGIGPDSRCKTIGKYYICFKDKAICIWIREFNTYKFLKCRKATLIDYNKLTTVWQVEKYFGV